MHPRFDLVVLLLKVSSTNIFIQVGMHAEEYSLYYLLQIIGINMHIHYLDKLLNNSKVTEWKSCNL